MKQIRPKNESYDLKHEPTEPKHELRREPDTNPNTKYTNQTQNGPTRTQIRTRREADTNLNTNPIAKPDTIPRHDPARTRIRTKPDKNRIRTLTSD